MDKSVTVVITSCGRFDLLQKSITSFQEVNTYPIKEYIVIDNSAGPYVLTLDILTAIMPQNTHIILNETNIGQVASIDKAYSEVKTPYIFHTEEDWAFHNPNEIIDTGYELMKQKEATFIQDSMFLLELDPTIMNVNIRKRNDGTKGSEHPVKNFQTKNNISWYEYESGYCGVYHGFSWNPGLRRLVDYKILGNFKQFGCEEGMNAAYYNLGYKAVSLEKSYCTHIGEDTLTELRNQ